jgi:hypothetical protein
MKDHASISSIPDDAREHHPIDITPSAVGRAGRREAEREVDRTTRLAAQVLGTTVKRAGDLLENIGGLLGLICFGGHPTKGVEDGHHGRDGQQEATATAAHG